MEVTKEDVRFPMAGCVTGSTAVPADANTNNQADCQIPPQISGHLRPNWCDTDEPTSKGSRLETYALHDVHATKCAHEIDRAQNDLRDKRVG